MVLADPQYTLLVTGDLYADPTSLASAPFGGTYLGQTESLSFKFEYSTTPITAEEFGGEIVDYLDAKDAATCGAIFTGITSAVVNTLFPNVIASGTDLRIANIAQGDLAGLASTRAVKLLFASHASGVHPSFIIYNAIPLVESSNDLALMLGERLGVGVIFHGTRDASDRVYQFGAREDLDL